MSVVERVLEKRRRELGVLERDQQLEAVKAPFPRMSATTRTGAQGKGCRPNGVATGGPDETMLS